MTIYRQNGQDFSTVSVEIEYKGNDRWWVVGEGFTSEHHAWDVYQTAVVRDGQDAAFGERKLFPNAYFIDPELQNPVTKSWLFDQVHAQEVIS